MKTILVSLFSLGLIACGGSTFVPPDAGSDATASDGSSTLDALPVHDAAAGDAISPTDAGAPADSTTFADSPSPVDAAADAPPPVVLVQAHQPTGIAVDAQFIYWADLGPPQGGLCPQNCPAIRRANLDGLNVTPIAEDPYGAPFPEDVVLFGDDVYWDSTGSGSGVRAIVHCPKAGCTDGGEALPNVGGFGYGTGIAIGDAGLFWAGLFQNGFPAVWRIDSADAGPSGPLVPGVLKTGTLALDSDHLYFGDWGDHVVGAIAADAPLADSGTPNYQRLAQMPMGDAAPALDFDAPSLFADGTSIFYAYGAGGVVGAIPKAGVPGGGDAPVLAWNVDGPMRVVTDATYAYWTVRGPDMSTGGGGAVYSNGSIMKCQKTGCGAAGPTVIATGLDVLSGYLAIDTSYLYFTVLGDGTIRRVAK